MTRQYLSRDDRGVSVAVNHVLAIGITTILITGLVFGAGSLLDSQYNSGSNHELRTIGNRLSGQLTSADAMAGRQGGAVSLRAEHPRRIVGSTYTVSLLEGSKCGLSAAGCLRLTIQDSGREVEVPVNVSAPIVESSVSGGPMYVVYDGDGLSLERASDGAPALAGEVNAPDAPSHVNPIGGSYGETRTQYAGGGGGGGGGGPSTTTAGGGAPSFNSYSVTDNSRCTGGGCNGQDTAEYDISWDVADASSVTVYVNNTDTGTNEATYSGLSDSVSFSEDGDHDENYEIKIIAEDSDGDRTCKTTTGVADGNADETTTTSC